MRAVLASRPYLARVALLLFAVPCGIVACGPSCGPSYPAGTRLRVTVLRAFDGCNVTLDAGQVYDLVAGPPREMDEGDGASCEANSTDSLPDFTTSAYSVGHCRPGGSAMTIQCEAGLPSCPRVASSTLSVHYVALPEDPGDAVQTELRISYASEPGCMQSCSARIPVSIAW
jgi:hypothetical protein